MGSINIPSHFNTVETSFFNGIFRKIGAITVGPVTIIKAENKKDICQLILKMKWVANPAPKKVTNEPSVINLRIAGPTFKISSFFNVKPPSNNIILIANDTKLNKRSSGNNPSVPFQIGSSHFVPSAEINVDIGPTNNPIKIKGKIAGSFNFQATHCAIIPKTIIPANSNIYSSFVWVVIC